jgi:hypothetical protein
MRRARLVTAAVIVMITGLPPDESGAVITRLSHDAIELTLDRVATAIRGTIRPPGTSAISRLRSFVDRCAAERPSGASALGALPDILGTAVTLQYPLMQLEHYLRGEPCDIGDGARAELYLSFTRYHLWKLEHLLRERTSA